MIRAEEVTKEGFESVRPFLRWPGGKSWLSRIVVNEVGAVAGRYFEPFLGGGAIFFALRPKSATLSDVNPDLINAYTQVRDHWVVLVDNLKRLRVTKKQFYKLRRATPLAPVDRAVRFLYLNRVGFSGMYRLNAKGEFNVPYGGRDRTTECLWCDRRLEKAASALGGKQIMTADFEDTINRADVGDVVYCDPTYTVVHENNGFRRYNERNFSWGDQKRLAQACWRARERGAMVLASNAYDPAIAKLYRGARVVELTRRSLVSRLSTGRREVHEYLFIMRKGDGHLKGRK